MSRAIFFIDIRCLRRSIHCSERFIKVVRFSGSVSVSVSTLPTWLVEVAVRSMARPPSTRRMAGSAESRSASFVSSHPAGRLNTDCRSCAPSECCMFLPRRRSCRDLSAISVSPNAHSSSRYAISPASAVIVAPGTQAANCCHIQLANHAFGFHPLGPPLFMATDSCYPVPGNESEQISIDISPFYLANVGSVPPLHGSTVVRSVCPDETAPIRLVLILAHER
jgi:hypothetical protein